MCVCVLGVHVNTCVGEIKKRRGLSSNFKEFFKWQRSYLSRMRRRFFNFRCRKKRPGPKLSYSITSKVATIRIKIINVFLESFYMRNRSFSVIVVKYIFTMILFASTLALKVKRYFQFLRNVSKGLLLKEENNTLIVKGSANANLVQT